MFRILNTVTLTLSVYALSGTAALAQGAWDGRFLSWLFSHWPRHHHGPSAPRRAVPEIDAGNGLMALAAVGATLALAYELNRRRKKQ